MRARFITAFILRFLPVLLIQFGMSCLGTLIALVWGHDIYINVRFSGNQPQDGEAFISAMFAADEDETFVFAITVDDKAGFSYEGTLRSNAVKNGKGYVFCAGNVKMKYSERGDEIAGEAPEYDICKMIVGIHKAHSIFLTDNEIRRNEKSRKYKQQLVCETEEKVLLRFCGSVFLEKPYCFKEKSFYIIRCRMSFLR